MERRRSHRHLAHVDHNFPNEGSECVLIRKGPFTINVRADIFRGREGEWGLEIFKKRSVISILVAFWSGHFRSSGEGG